VTIKELSAEADSSTLKRNAAHFFHTEQAA
jgi:hypothetical protein